MKLLYRVKPSNLYIKQLDFSRDSLHLVDIRGSQCNVWEPAALHRASISEDSTESTSPFVEVIASEARVKISAILLSNKETYVACGKDDGSVCVYELQTGTQTNTLYHHKSRVHILTWVPGGKIIMSVDTSNSILAWSVEDSKEKTLITDQQIFQARLDCGYTITQLLPNSAASKFILSTRESDHLWRMVGKQEQLRIPRDSPGLCKWLQHPQSAQHVICMDGAAVRIHTWDDWSQVRTISTTIDMRHLQLKSVVSCMVNRRPSILIELSELHGGADTRSLGLLDLELLRVESGSGEPVSPFGNDERKDTAISVTTKQSTREASTPLRKEQLRIFSGRVSHVIGISDARKLIFLDKHSWVCSVGLDDVDGKRIQYSRHFFVPYDWFSGTRGIHCALSRRNILFACNDNVAIVKGGLEYAETVIIPLAESEAKGTDV